MHDHARIHDEPKDPLIPKPSHFLTVEIWPVKLQILFAQFCNRCFSIMKLKLFLTMGRLKRLHECSLLRTTAIRKVVAQFVGVALGLKIHWC
jgi:hypothetical protein